MGAKIKKGTITGTNINLAKLGTVPSAASANTAATAGTANALSALESTRLVGASGQPPFFRCSSNISGRPFKFQPVGFYKDHEGIVHLSGTATVGSEEPVIHGLLFTLPPDNGRRAGPWKCSAGSKKTQPFLYLGQTRSSQVEVSGDVLSSSKTGKSVILSGDTFRAES